MVRPGRCSILARHGIGAIAKPESSLSPCRECYAEQLAGVPAEETSALRNLIVEHEGPNVLQMAVNFWTAVVRHAADGFRKASKEERARRKVICQSCSEWFDRQTNRCLHPKCGCRMSLKVSWNSERCPIEKWDDK